MDIKYLEYILAIAEEKNITKAARRLYVSQPTLSQFLARQEAEIGTPLFQRFNGEYSLTSAGELYSEYARKVLKLHRQLESDLAKISETKQIRFGTSSSGSLERLISVLADFRTRYPNVELILSSGNLRNMMNFIDRGEIDIALVTAHSLDKYQKQSIELGREEILFAVPSSFHAETITNTGSFHHSADSCSSAYPSLDASELIEKFGRYPLILQREGSCIRYLVDSFFKDCGFHPTLACSTNQAQAIYDMVSARIGTAFIPLQYARKSPELIFYSLQPKLYRIQAIIYRKDLIPDVSMKYLIELMKK